MTLLVSLTLLLAFALTIVLLVRCIEMIERPPKAHRAPLSKKPVSEVGLY